MRRIIAIIPGTTGHICIRDGNAILSVIRMPSTSEELSEVVRQAAHSARMDGKDLHAYIEKPGNPIRTLAQKMFSCWRSLGRAEQAMSDFGIRTTFVSANAWQKEIGMDVPMGSSQNECRNLMKSRVMALFPDVEATHMNSRAILLSEYAYHTEETLSRSSPAQSGHE